MATEVDTWLDLQKIGNSELTFCRGFEIDHL